MREIKVRAWDKKSKKMREVSTIVYWRTGDICSASDIGKIKLVQLVGRDPIEQKEILITRESGEFILYECTGQKDINSVDVYNGDIINVYATEDYHDNSRHTVIWGGDTDYPAFDITDSCDISEESNIFSYMAAEGIKFEVVGNIHQPPTSEL